MKRTPVQRVLNRITLAQTKHPLWVFSIALGLAALSILYTVRNLEFQTGQMDLISPEDPLKRKTEQLRALDELDTFIVVIENRNGRDPLEFLHALLPLLESDSSSYRQVFYRVDPEAFRPWALLYLGMEELADLQESIREHRSFIQELARSPGLLHFFEAVNREMTHAMVGEIFTGFLDLPGERGERGPLDLSLLSATLEQMKQWLDGGEPAASPWGSLFMGMPGGVSEEGYFWTEDRRYLLIFITPAKGEGFTQALPSLTALRGKIAGLKTEFPGIDVGVTGMEALNQDEMGVAMRDMEIATLISFVCLALLLVIFWRGWRLPLLEMVELSVALSCTFGLTTLVVGHLNILSITFAPLLLGLGIDYGIHWLARYQEEVRRAGVSKEEAVQRVTRRLGPGILLAGLTASLSFLPLTLTGFKGLVELGLVTSMGMIVTTMTTLCLLPVLALLFGGKVRGGADSAGPEPRTGLLYSRRRAVAVVIPGGRRWLCRSGAPPLCPST